MAGSRYCVTVVSSSNPMKSPAISPILTIELGGKKGTSFPENEVKSRIPSPEASLQPPETRLGVLRLSGVRPTFCQPLQDVLCRCRPFPLQGLDGAHGAQLVFGQGRALKLIADRFEAPLCVEGGLLGQRLFQLRKDAPAEP